MRLLFLGASNGKKVQHIMGVSYACCTFLSQAVAGFRAMTDEWPLRSWDRVVVDLTADSDDDVEVVESVGSGHGRDDGVGSGHRREDGVRFRTASAPAATRGPARARTVTATPAKKPKVKHRDRRRDWDSPDLLATAERPSYVYIIVNDKHSVYTGSTQNPTTRLKQHNDGHTTRSTHAGRPWRLAATIGPFRTTTAATRFESLVKRGGAGVEAKINAAGRALKASPRSTNICISRL